MVHLVLLPVCYGMLLWLLSKPECDGALLGLWMEVALFVVLR
jgi:hypothetical protein